MYLPNDSSSVDVTRDKTSKEEQESSPAIVYQVTGLYYLMNKIFYSQNKDRIPERK